MTLRLRWAKNIKDKNISHVHIKAFKHKNMSNLVTVLILWWRKLEYPKEFVVKFSTSMNDEYNINIAFDLNFAISKMKYVPNKINEL